VKTPGFLLAFAVLAPPIAWAVQLVSGYAVSEAACSTATGEPPVLGSPMTVLWAVSAAAIAVAGLAGLVGLVSWSRARADRGTEPAGRIALLGAAGALAGLVFLEAIVLSTVALIPFEACGPS
jgi:hypothetical protein